MRKALLKILFITAFVMLCLLVVQLLAPQLHVMDDVLGALSGLGKFLNNLLAGHVSVK